MLFGKKHDPDREAIIAELRQLTKLVEGLNIASPANDYEVGFDTAIDEVLDLINGRIKIHSSK